MITPFDFGAAMIRMSGDTWVQQVRLISVCQAAAVEQMQIAWGMRSPRASAPDRREARKPSRPGAAPKPARPRAVRRERAEEDNMPV
jgi:hypothetical protein